ncbi:MAG: endonuclease V [Rhodocyclaceae bacterium]|nr:endonuclease V [Rhodocyclaceae bacterium]
MKIRSATLGPRAPGSPSSSSRQLAGEIVLHDDFGLIGRVAGVDVGSEDNGGTTRAAVAVLAYPSLQLETATLARTPTFFPYVPELLSFREAPAVLEAIENNWTSCRISRRPYRPPAPARHRQPPACCSTFLHRRSRRGLIERTAKSPFAGRPGAPPHDGLR